MACTVDAELKKAVDKFVDANVHCYYDDGCYVEEGLFLHFDKEEHDSKFSRSYYIPDYKDWLMENAKLVRRVKP